MELRPVSGNQTDPPPPASRWSRVRAILGTDAQRLFSTGVPHILAALLLTQGIGLIRRVLLVRILTVAEVGQMAYVMRIVDFVVALAELGISMAVLKYAAEPVSEERKRNIYSTGLVASAAVSTAVTLVYVFVVVLIPFHSDPTLGWYALIVAPCIPFRAVLTTPILYMQARKQAQRAARYTTITQGIGLGVIVSATWFFRLTGTFLSMAAAPFVNLFLLLWATREHLVRPRRFWETARSMFAFGSVSVLLHAAALANVTVVVVLLRSLTGSDEMVGLYAIPALIMNNARLLGLALMRAAFPYLAQLVSDPPRLRRRVRELIVKQTAVLSGLVVAFALVGRWVIIWVFGSAYELSYVPSVVLLLSLIPFSMSAPMLRVMIIVNKLHLNVVVVFVQLSLNVAVCLWAIPEFGLVGAAMGPAIAQAGSTVVALVFGDAILRKLKPRPPTADREAGVEPEDASAS
jgi:O-antigen/teichoic acid export membrane protein